MTNTENRIRQTAGSYQRAKTRRKMLYLQEIKSTTPCADCGVQYPYYVMTFDHLPEKGPKLVTLGHVQRGRISWETLHAEVAKCQVVCANCQAIRTHRRNPF